MLLENEIREFSDLYEERSRVQRNILYKREILKQNELSLSSVNARIKNSYSVKKERQFNLHTRN